MGPGRGRVLVVDDDPISMAAIKAVLEPDGYRIDSARGGREALAEIAVRRPDCVVLDYAMPEMTGLEVVRALRDLGDQTPVIMFSAKSDSYDKTAGYASGADIYIGKDEDPGCFEQRLAGSCSSTSPAPPGLRPADSFSTAQPGPAR